MAQLYQRIYRYTGQTSWTSNDRTAPWSEFELDENNSSTAQIKQIVSVTYTHYNNSHSSRNWTLCGGLVLSDGTVIFSSNTTEYIKHDTPKLYINTFETVPTVSQFNNIIAVRTYTDGNYTDNDVLTWRADGRYVMEVSITYYNEEPLVYKPTFEKFGVVRGVSTSDYSTGERNEKGTKALFTIGASAINRTATLDLDAELSIYYSVGSNSTNWTLANTFHTFSTWLQNGLVDASITGIPEISVDEDYSFKAVFTYGGESTTAYATVANNFVALHISGCSTGGVAIGDMSNATEGNPMFEVHHPSYFKKPAYFEETAYFQNGISQITSGSAFQYGTLTTATTVKDGGTATQTINFSPAFSKAPCLFITPICEKSKLFYVVTSITESQAVVKFFNDGSGDYSATVQWLAISGGTSTAGGSSTPGSGSDEGGGGSSGSGSTVSVSANYPNSGFGMMSIVTLTVDGKQTTAHIPTSDEISNSSSNTLATAAAVNALRLNLIESINSISSGATNAITDISFSNGLVTSTRANNTEGPSFTIYRSDTSIPSNGVIGDLFFLI